MRGWFCNVWLLLGFCLNLAGLMTIFYSLNFKSPPNLKGQVPVLVTPGTR
jgi:hypothetical protein